MAKTHAELNRVGMSRNEIARELGFTKQYIAQVEEAALLKLRRAAQGCGSPERITVVDELRELLREISSEQAPRLAKRGGVWRQVQE